MLYNRARARIPPAASALLSSRSRPSGLYTGLVKTESRVVQKGLQISGNGNQKWIR